MFWKETNQKELLESPRPHHYSFAHEALRQLCQSDPLQFFALMASDQQPQVIDFLYNSVCEFCDEYDAADFSAQDIDIACTRMNDCPTVLVVMPETKAVAEAIMVAVVLTSSQEEVEQEKVSFRYLLLEQGVDLRGEPITMFCAWEDEHHVNLGEGCEPTPVAFKQLVENQL